MSLKKMIKKNKVVYNMIYKTYLLIEKMFFSCLTCISPALNTKARYKHAFGKKLDLSNPQTLDEKILWLKLNRYMNDPLVIQCADKYRVREYVKDCGCGDILNELYAVYNNVDDINWEELPNQFAMKLNFGCGFNIICEDKESLNTRTASKQMKKWSRSRYYLSYSEMQYKGVPKKIIVEKYLSSENGKLPDDYKVYCFNGKAKYVMVCVERDTGQPKFFYFDKAWNLQMLSKDAKESAEKIEVDKPKNVDLLFEIADKLSEPFEFVRCDFYIVDDRVYFGELTFTPGGGMDTARLSETQNLFGELLQL